MTSNNSPHGIDNAGVDSDDCNQESNDVPKPVSGPQESSGCSNTALEMKRGSHSDDCHQESNDVPVSVSEHQESSSCSNTALEMKSNNPLHVIDNAGFDSGDCNQVSNDVTEPVSEPQESSGCWNIINSWSSSFSTFLNKNKTIIGNVTKTIFLVAYIAYFSYACYYDWESAQILAIWTGIIAFVLLYSLIRDTFGKQINKACCKPISNKWQDNWRYIKWPLFGLIIAGLIVALVFLTLGSPEQLISAAGLVIFVLLTFLFSKHPRQVKWRPVLWGLMLQFLLGLFVLRTDLGFTIFEWLGDMATIFLEFTDVGSEFVFGASYEEHFFAFKVLPVVIYFSSVISVLYYLGAMQVIIKKIAWLMQNTMKTSASESLNAAGNIFVGQTEAPLLIRPFLKDMTLSELHAVMTGGFATIAGSVLGAYISFGIDASHLISASVMSAPAALAIAKLFWPETEESQTATEDQFDIPKSEERNVIEAASFGASTAVSLVGNIAANLIAFLAILAFLNALLTWFGGLVGLDDPPLTFELICSYVFVPVAFIMGVEWEDCREVAELIGVKTFINEFVAYERLAVLIEEGALSKRSEIIATYALCGFANIGSIGIQLGGLTPMAPERKGDLAKVAIRALIAGTTACFMTACIAGVLYEIPVEEGTPGNATSVMTVL
ncbi:solute carrier family 28 member 3-like isoform X2 [Anneissia japonica]|nr:solute carrier family 28 member 3-like isoform X2 [Anneissia japonica]XP_033101663.1 solute carrier family 28 member 3-like isoform X2 [Anneissia japonica]